VNANTNFPVPANSVSASTFQVDHYLQPDSTEANQLILFIHGWRMTQFDYGDFSDTMFKRLYWSGYQGKFAALRWPTRSADTDGSLLQFFTYDRSEFIAFDSGLGTSAYLDNLASRYTNYDIGVTAHSMGNIVMMEALKDQLAEGHSVVDNYVLMQGAVPAHCYDTSSALNYSRFTTISNQTPDTYRGYPGAINNAIQGSMVNFFNTNDYALATGIIDLGALGTMQVNWEENEADTKPFNFQPFVQYGWNGTTAFQYLSASSAKFMGRFFRLWEPS
jgi:pimeloyl-ACP methyl ester carboxylesterase